ncbi:MAG: hypothetical protein KL787_02440 [Taibaiella sp.]|nr:hypothetical protein [Taibaiella sp.]
MSELKTELKSRIIEALNLEEVQVEDIGDDAPLFGGRFGTGLYRCPGKSS